MTRFLSAAIGLIAFVGLSAGATGDPARRSPVVVELFTSQGCSSCPPAEAFLTELAKRDGIVALEFHVDYWDYIGWKDTFAKPEFTARQKAYVTALKGRYTYTPQMVIHGRTHVVGSHRDEVESVIRQYLDDIPKGPVISMKRQGGSVMIAIGGAAAASSHDVVFVTYDKPHLTEIGSGENGGRTLKNSNVVRELMTLGSWSGQATKFDVALAGKEGDGGCAVLLQAHDQGPILVAAALDFGP